MDCIKPLSKIVRKLQAGRSDYSESGGGDRTSPPCQAAYLGHSIQYILYKRLLGIVEFFRCPMLVCWKETGKGCFPFPDVPSGKLPGRTLFLKLNHMGKKPVPGHQVRRFSCFLNHAVFQHNYLISILHSTHSVCNDKNCLACKQS